MRHALPTALLLILGLAGAASAQPVATAGGRADELSTARQIDEWLAEAPPATAASRAGAGPQSPWADEGADAGAATFTRRVIGVEGPPIARTLADGQVHGEAGAEIGTLGYGGYGVVSGPLGKNGAIQIGVSHFEGNGRAYRRAQRRLQPGDSTSLSLSAAWSPNRDAGWARPTTPVN